jgi:glycosyltransferase involved in cell wall biosynthesis
MVSKPLHIGVIYGGISDQKVGMDQYAQQILLTMKQLAPEHRYVLIDHRRQTDPFRNRFEQLVIPLPKPPAAVSRWNLIEVPRVLSRFDLVFSPGLYGPPRLPADVKGVMVVHDLVRYLFPRFFVFNLMQKALDRWAYPRMLRNYRHLITVSESTKQDLIRLFQIPAEKITVTHHGAGTEFHPVDDPGGPAGFLQKYNLSIPFILFLGTLEPRKNLTTLIQALALLKEKIPHSLVLVGQKGWLWEEIFKAVTKHGLQDRVHWTGYIPDEDRVLFYNAADFLVYPSWYEGFGMPVLEALQSGCPVIASRVSALPEVVGEAGLLIDPGNTEDLAGAMLRMVEAPELRQSLREAGLVRARQFSWEESARKTLEVFEAATSSAPSLDGRGAGGG